MSVLTAGLDEAATRSSPPPALARFIPHFGPFNSDGVILQHFVRIRSVKRISAKAE